MKLWKAQSGQALVETALTLPMLIALLLGAVEMTRVVYMGIEVSNAAEAAAIYASQNRGAETGTWMQTLARNDASDLYNSTNISLTATPSCVCETSTGAAQVECTSDAAAACVANSTTNMGLQTIITVETSATFDPLVYIPGLPHTFTIQGKAVQKVLN
jgi:Flp pilus assembly protein TadG